MADKAKLKDMVNNMIDQKPEQAQVDFHEYLQAKMGEVVHGPGDEESENKDNEE